MAQLVIFSDIDGTLIDFESYSFADSAAAVAGLANRGIPLVLCSSKTRSEQEALRPALGITDPFIVENGSAIIIPAGCLQPAMPPEMAAATTVIELGLPATSIRAALVAARCETGLELRGLSDMTTAEVAQVTGLDEPAAARARQRQYSETITTPLSAADLQRLRAAPSMRGLRVVSGGRFHTVTGDGGDKGLAVARLAGLYRRQFDDIVTIGLGDSANDAPLLAAVDRPYLVQKPGGVWQQMDVPGLVRVAAVGPLGWRMVIEELFELG